MEWLAPAREARQTNSTRSRALGWVGLASSLLTLAGCVSSGAINSRAAINQALRSRGLDPTQVVVPFELNDEMKQWVHEAAPRRLGQTERLKRLNETLLEAREWSIEYAWGYTGTAEEVFYDRRANCLAFTNLFLAMAREAGVPVYFLAVERVETFRKEGDLVVVSDHVAVGHGDSSTDLTVFDFSEHRNESYRQVRRISDLTAIAMFHSNRGAEALQRGEVSAALDWLRKALAIDPELVHGWVNLGVVLRRAGDLSGAEAAYKHALEIDPRMASAYQNLAALLDLQGRSQEAHSFIQVLRKTPSRNPFSYLSLGDISLRSGRLEEAKRYYRRAVSLSRDNAEIYAALGQVAIASGDLRTARKMLRRARKIDGQNPRAVRLAALIEGGSG